MLKNEYNSKCKVNTLQETRQAEKGGKRYNMKKVEIGKTYEILDDYRLITPLSYNDVSKTYTCKVEEPVFDENSDDCWCEPTYREYESELTTVDILYF